MTLWKARRDLPPPSQLRMVGGFPCHFVAGASSIAPQLDASCYCLLLRADEISLFESIENIGAVADSCLLLFLPRAALNGRLPSLRVGQAERSLAPLLISLIQSAYRNALHVAPDQHLAVRDALLALVVAGWGRADPSIAEAGLLRRAKSYISRHLDNPCLSPKSVAKAEGVSVRHLHRLFSATGVSLGDWIRASRLERCAADLRSLARAGDTLTEIAFRWGFSDSAGFSRAFRAAFQQTPRDYRAHHLKDQIPACRGRTVLHNTAGDFPWL